MTAPRPYRLGRAAPGVPVRDLDTALAFYVGVLGHDRDLPQRRAPSASSSSSATTPRST